MATKSTKTKGIDVCAIFDTTGSMYPCLASLRQRITEVVKRLFTELDDVHVSIIAHGDYCDKGNPYDVKVLDFTTNERKLTNFIQNVERTFGGDAPECYELALHEATKLSWREDSKKVVIMAGDDIPHTTTYKANTLHLDWAKELATLKSMGVKVYPVHAMPGIRRHSKGFYETVARLSGTTYLNIDQFAIITDLVLATVYAQTDEVSDINDLSDFNTSYCMNNNILALMGKTADIKEFKTDKNGLIPVADGAYQTFYVTEDTPIQVFVEGNGIEFKKGKGFYELTKTETVQQYKEVFLQSRATGKLFGGPQVRKLLGLMPQSEGTRGGVKERIKPVFFDDYRVFIQSTSYNRKLKANTLFLYQVNDMDCVFEEFKYDGVEEVKAKPLADEKTKVTKTGKPSKAKKPLADEKTKVTKAVTKKPAPIKEAITKRPVSSTEVIENPKEVTIKKDPVKYVKGIDGKRRRVQAGDVLCSDNHKVSATVVVEDGKIMMRYKGKVVDFNVEGFDFIYTPKLNSKGEPDRRISRYRITEKEEAKYCRLKIEL